MIAEKRIQALEKRVDELADRLERAEDEALRSFRAGRVGTLTGSSPE